MAQSLNSYIQQEWLDYPTSLIGHNCGENFALWLIENDASEFQIIMSDESIQEAMIDAQKYKILGNERDIESAELDLKKLILSVFQENLIDAIRDLKNSYDEQEEMRLESISFDNARMM